MKIVHLQVLTSTKSDVNASEYRSFLEGEVVSVGRSHSNDIVLGNQEVSSKHCSIEVASNNVKIFDLGSQNGTFQLGDSISAVRLFEGDEVSLARVASIKVVGFSISKVEAPKAEKTNEPKTRYVGSSFVLGNGSENNDSGKEVPLDLFRAELIDPASLIRSDIHVSECHHLAAGGGLGSFVYVDHLRVFGVAKDHIRVLGDTPVPYGNYERYCKNSQIPPQERLRSNSLSTPDNIWGFPGYASRESWTGFRHGKLSELKHVFAVFGEPALAISYTPRASDVFHSVDREAQRIGWKEMFTQGRIRALRKTTDDRYAILYRRQGQTGPDYGVILSKYVQLATGYPAVRFLDDLQGFKAAQPDLQHRVINAYDPHDEVYNDIVNKKDLSVVVVRGRGIVASRILQRLSEVRAHNPNLKIIHLLRSKRDYGTGSRFGRTKRPVFNDVEIQPFNWPKACWGGNLRERIEEMSDHERAEIFKILGGTTTAEREDWTALIENGIRDGWYTKYYGQMRNIDAADGVASQILCTLKIEGDVQENRQLKADYIIDCTGLIADLTKAPFLQDLISTYRLPRYNGAAPGQSPMFSGLKVSNSFEVRGLRNGQGRVYAAGQLVGGGPYAAVDSFLGLQYCALRSVEHLVDAHGSGLKRLSALGSYSQWRKWCKNTSP